MPDRETEGSAGKDLRSRLERAREIVRGSTGGSAATFGAVRLTRLLEISAAMNRKHDRDELLCYLRDRLQELFDAENSVVALVDENGDAHPLTGRGDPAARISRTIVRRAIDRRAPFLVEDAAKDAELRDRDSVLRLKLVSVLCAPLIVDDEVIGLIQFDHPTHPSPFSGADLAVLELFAHQAGTALKNVLSREHLERTLTELRETQDELVDAERLRAVGETAAAAAHDFNNLLTSMLGLTELLEGADLPESALRDVRAMRTVVETGIKRVASVQRAAGVRRDPAEPDEPIDLSLVIDDVVAMTRPRVLAGRYELLVRKEPVPVVLGQAAVVRELLLNLVYNALDAMPGGGRVTIRARPEGDHALIEVEDRGPGIPPALGRQVFEPRFSTKPMGHGLGLWICRQSVHRMRGSIDHRPAPGRGTCFTVRLPAAQGKVPSSIAPAPTDGFDCADDVAPASILVVDDEAEIRGVMARIVARAGHRVTGAASAEEAIRRFEGDSFDLVVSDVGLPEMSGLDLVRELRRRGERCAIVLVSGHSRPIDVEHALRQGVAAVLTKPVSSRVVTATIRRALSS